MKIKRKIAKTLLISLCLVNVCSVPCFAYNATNESVAAEVTPRYDEIGYKYIKVNGVCFRRRWNYTKAVWVDSVWSACPASSHNH